MPILKVEVLGADDADLAPDLPEKIRAAFSESFSSDWKYVDVRVTATPHARFCGHYERGDEPVWVDALMAKLPGINDRRAMTKDFSARLAKLVGRDVGTIVLHLTQAPPDRLAFGGTLLDEILKK
ncbi:MAG: hypothetical protein M5R36_25510 [Deltaproteobacteria bacterium]|nr:hypothetical protein [Deltaproteobacteria bacterium]